MKLIVDRFVYEPPGLSIIPETDFEAALLARYWESAKLTKGKAGSFPPSADGFSYGVKFGFDRGESKDKQPPKGGE